MFRINKNIQWLRHLDFALMDCLLMFLCQLFVGSICGRSWHEMMSGSYATLLTLLNLVSVITILMVHPHKEIIQRGYWKEFTAMVRQYVLHTLLLIVCLFAVHIVGNFMRREIIGAILLTFAVNYVCRTGLKHVIRDNIRKSDKRNKMVLVTTSDSIEDLWDQMTTKNYPNYRITAAVLTDVKAEEYDVTPLLQKLQTVNTSSFVERGMATNRENRGLTQDNVTVICGIEEANKYILSQVVDEIYLDVTEPKNYWRDYIRQYYEMGIVVHIGLPGVDYDYPNRYIGHYGNRLAITTTINMAPSWKLNLKRGIDICGALVGLVITGIACLFIIPAIKIADPGPVFFVQTRIGRNGRPFRFYKFRSMYMDAEKRKAELMKHNQMQGFMFKMENDPRIIGSEKGPGKGFGNFIRKTSIDELPQFWNILRGDMSLVGTRPPTMGEYQQYEMHHKARLSMRPGLTGLWQVSGRSDITDFEEVVKLDCEYIENWTLGLDFKIILRTVLIVLGKSGAR